MTRKFFSVLLLVLLLTGACQPTQPTPASENPAGMPPSSTLQAGEAQPESVRIHEVLAGIEGNNNHDFIVLHNPLDQMANLNGWSLWYQVSEGKEAGLVYQWEGEALVAPHGYYLLGREAETFTLLPDAFFSLSILPIKGGLELRQPDGTPADRLGWGAAPESLTEGSAAPPMENGMSLSRQKGAPDSNNNRADFSLNNQPQPLNSASLPENTGEQALLFSIQAPETVAPGQEFSYTLTLENKGSRELSSILVRVPIPMDNASITLPAGFSLQDQAALLKIASLPAAGKHRVEIMAQAPWEYLTLAIRNAYALAEGSLNPVFCGPVYTQVTEGSLPVATARSLPGMNVIVEGIVTMYSGGFYAGSGGKFYLEDDSGGIQVYLPGNSGGADLDVSIGDYVRVEGKIEPYRGSIEIIPSSLEQVKNLEVSGQNGDRMPAETSIEQLSGDLLTFPGRLVQVEGAVTRAEEFSYSYELDLSDQNGNLLTLYIDKLTGMNIDLVEVGQRYRAAGIVEISDTVQRLNPRRQSDMERLYPPGLAVSAMAPTTAKIGETFIITFEAANYAPETVTGAFLRVTLPAQIKVDAIENEGSLEEDTLTWELGELSGNEKKQVNLQVHLADGVGFSHVETYLFSANELETATGKPFYVFAGSHVPIWAIQGGAERSPYIATRLQTRGVVTGIFPDLGGFWIQNPEPDQDKQTSEGLFVSGDTAKVNVGDLVEVSGTVREVYQQTLVAPEEPADLVVIGSGSRLPGAYELDPPAAENEALAYYEALEGMLVQVSAPALAVAPTNAYGEFVCVLESTQRTRLMQGEENGIAIMVDDGNAITHEDASTIPYLVHSGDNIEGIFGPLAFNYDRYKVEPVAPVQITPGNASLPAIDPVENGQFSLMTWNVENLFDYKEPHPSDPAMPSLETYRQHLDKIANTILAAGAPSIIGFQEVENIEILQDLAGHELLVVYHYQPVLIEGTDSRGIDVGYLVRGDQAVVENVQQYPAPEGLTSRPPLGMQVSIKNAASPMNVFVLNNHFTSMSGGVSSTEPRRIAQAEWNASIAKKILNGTPGANLAIIGDLNSYYNSPPINILKDAGFEHLFDALPPEERYTYIYQGISQTLDHILVSPGLAEHLVRVEVLHVNADYPPTPPGDTSAQHKSDHDPVVAIFSAEE